QPIAGGVEPLARGERARCIVQEHVPVDVVAQGGPIAFEVEEAALGPEVVVGDQRAVAWIGTSDAGVDDVLHTGTLRGVYRGRVAGVTAAGIADGIGADDQQPVNALEGGIEAGRIGEVAGADLDALDLAEPLGIAGDADYVPGAATLQVVDHRAAKLPGRAGYADGAVGKVR